MHLSRQHNNHNHNVIGMFLKDIFKGFYFSQLTNPTKIATEPLVDEMIKWRYPYQRIYGSELVKKIVYLLEEPI